MKAFVGLAILLSMLTIPVLLLVSVWAGDWRLAATAGVMVLSCFFLLMIGYASEGAKKDRERRKRREEKMAYLRDRI